MAETNSSDGDRESEGSHEFQGSQSGAEMERNEQESADEEQEDEPKSPPTELQDPDTVEAPGWQAFGSWMVRAESRTDLEEDGQCTVGDFWVHLSHCWPNSANAKAKHHHLALVWHTKRSATNLWTHPSGTSDHLRYHEKRYDGLAGSVAWW